MIIAHPNIELVTWNPKWSSKVPPKIVPNTSPRWLDALNIADETSFKII